MFCNVFQKLLTLGELVVPLRHCVVDSPIAGALTSRILQSCNRQHREGISMRPPPNFDRGNASKRTLGTIAGRTRSSRTDRSLRATMSASFSQTLKSITVTKLRGISKQVSDFNVHREKILLSLSAAKSSQEKVQILLDGIDSWRDVGVSFADSTLNDVTRNYLRNVKKFLVQAERDPSIGEETLNEWETNFRKYLGTEKAKNEYAELFGKLLNEWTAGESASVSEKTTEEPNSTGIGEVANEAGERIGSKEMHKQWSMFKSLVFTAKETDIVAIVAYLEDLFSSKAANEKLVSIRDDIRSFGEELLRTKLTDEDVKSVVSSLLQADLLSNEKRDTLKEFTRNTVVLTEVTDVLNMHLSSLSSWAWFPDHGTAESEAVPLEMRRQLNGKYRIFMDEEILQAVFLHWIGIKWAAEFKRHFMNFIKSSAWTLSRKPLTKKEKERREYFLGDREIFPRDLHTMENISYPTTIDEARRAKQLEFFMSQLPESLEEGGGAAYADDEGAAKLKPVGIKQSLLHNLTTECLFNTTLYNQFTVVRSDIAWFGPSLPHSSILTALRFFGVPQVWLAFFQKFLSAPLKFDLDGPSAPSQTRKRGVPISHSLSDLFGEVLLFCMDYAVNQRAEGLFLYRMHDDFWLWNRDSELCVKAWQEMSTFTRLVGLEFNFDKTGSASVGQPLHPDLPKGLVKWGLLIFEESGQFVIDQSQVDTHILELQRQLKACEHSVFAWVQAYNKYAASFFVNNFGSPPAQCFGQRHVDMVIDALQRIHLALFPNHGGSVIKYLADVIHARFGIRDIPPGWFLWPMAMGGLEVKSPLIPQFSIRDHLCIDPAQKLKGALKLEKETYTKVQEAWDSGETKMISSFNWDLRNEPFMSYEEYARHRERYSGTHGLVNRDRSWESVFSQLLAVPEDLADGTGGVHKPSNLVTELSNLSQQFHQPADCATRGICSDWTTMTAYWRWVVACYGEGMVEKWGGLEVVSPGTLPIGMVEVWKSRKFRWER